MTIRLATINLEVRDPERSKRFYADAFGFTENAERSHAPGFVYLNGRGIDLTLALPEHAETVEPSRSIELGFEVDDIDAVSARLRDAGIDGFSPQSMGWGDVLEGRDPDGHRVIVYKFRS